MVYFTTITSPDINNGSGFRVTLWISGCTHNCPGCHNAYMKDYSLGVSLEDCWKTLIEQSNHPYIQGLTLSGGDPLDRCDEDLDQIKRIIERYKGAFPDKDIWLYTGFNVSELNDKQMEICMLCDYIVDGRYVESMRDLSLAFRGSSNQTIWKVYDNSLITVSYEFDHPDQPLL